MLSRKLKALLLAPVLVLLMAAGPVLVDPAPMVVPPGLSDQAVEKAIRTGVAQRGWVVSRQQPGDMEATLHLRSHVARIGIKYDAMLIQIRYLDSQNLDYEVKKGVPHIHRNYLKWINNIIQDINVQLQAAAVDLERSIAAGRELMQPLCVTAYSVASAAGTGLAALAGSLRDRRSGLRPNDFTDVPLATFIGRVPGVEDVVLPGRLAEWDCRNNRLAWIALRSDGFLERAIAARDRYGPDRVALVLGTSTSSIGATEEAYRRLLPDGQYPEDLRRPIVHTPHSLGDFVREALQLEGIAVTVGTACSSSAKVFGQAERLMRLGLVDAAIVGGVDSLCGSVLFGFNSLELVSPEPCRPFDIARRGISIGEGGGFALLERDGERGPWLLGYGESSDAHHMSSPHPQGLGARLAITAALDSADVNAGGRGLHKPPRYGQPEER